MTENCEKNNYEWLKSLIYGWIGSNYSNLGEHSKAISYNRQSLKTAEKTSDAYNIQRALNQLTNEYQKIGDLRQASNFSFQSVALSNSYYLSPRQKFRNLNFATQVLSGRKLFDAAFSFGRENLNLVQNQIRDKWLSHSVVVQLGVLNGELHKYEEAYKDFEASLRIAETIPDKTKIDQLSAKSYLSLANVQRQANECDAAIDNYNQASRIYAQTQLSVNNYESEKGKLLCYAAQQNDSAVTEAMPRLIKSFDSYRQNLREEERATFFDAEQDVYDAAIDYAYTNLQDAEQSFNYAENSRARSLLNTTMRENEQLPQPLLLTELRRQIPVNAQIVYYAVLTDKTLIWVISNTRFAAVKAPVTRIELENKISKYTKDIIEKPADENIGAAARDLYRLLIEPIENSLEKDKTICFVADKSLLRLPFASLVSPAANKYLIEDYAVLTAPSATVFINETEIAGKKSADGRETILSIGNPFFSRAEYPKLADLPAAAREAEEIASMYETSKVYVGRKAVKKRIIDSFFEADIIHFAGHYVPNAKSPSFSKLLLTSNDSNKEDKDLMIEEITRDKLPRARLIILSACETGIEKFYNGEGMIGAARAFLKAEVPLVIG
ncbi:MAG TPA: CHAT domain-containing tetratricopeptide repeat protein, partial [Pyrinomonadaceae bacterium]